MIFKTAFLSLLSHNHKTLLILIVLSISACLTFLGFTASHTIETNTRESLTNTVAGDIVVYSSEQENAIDMLAPIQYINPIEEYSDLQEYLDNFEPVEHYTPYNKGIVFAYNEMTEQYIEPLSFVGTDIEEYMSIFEKVKLVEGEMIPDVEKGVLISKSFIEDAKEQLRKMMSKGFQGGGLPTSPKDIDSKKEDNPSTKNNDTGKEGELSIQETEINDNEETILSKDKDIEELDNSSPSKDNNSKGEETPSSLKVDDSEKKKEIPPSQDAPDKKGFSGMFDMFKNMNPIDEKYSIGNTIKVATTTSNGLQKVTKLKIYGLIEMTDTNEMLSSYNIIDLETYKEMSGYDAESNILTIEEKKALDRNEKFLMDFDIEDESQGTGSFDESSLDSFFDDMVEEEEAKYDSEELDLDKYREVDDEDIIQVAEQSGMTEYIILRLNDPSKIDSTVNQLNNYFDQNDMLYKAVSYKESSSSLGSYMDLSNIVLTSIIFLIQIISVIIITNSILMGIIERTNEIGTMRAIGAHQGYIFKLIFSESFIASIIASLIGIAFGFFIMDIVNVIQIQTNDMITMLFFGGNTLQLFTTGFNVLLSVGLVVSVTMLSTIYPVIFSTKLTPLEAMNKI